MEEKKIKKVSKGGKKLILLGVFATLIALITTGISLIIYHNSGDIYLDRSRPGFLPDEEEIEQKDDEKKEEVYDFSQQKDVTVESLTEYLDKLTAETEELNAYTKPFDMEILSDEHFGIPASEDNT